MWQGLKTITEYKGKPRCELPSDASPLDKLNAFYARFEASNTEACTRTPAVLDDCVITLSVADVNNTFKQVNIHKDMGPDRLPALVLRVCTATVGMTASMHFLMKPMTEVLYSSMLLDDSRNICQSVIAKQSCSLASASSDHFFIDRVTSASCFNLCLYAGIRRIELWSDLPNGGRRRALYASLCLEYR